MSDEARLSFPKVDELKIDLTLTFDAELDCWRGEALHWETDDEYFMILKCASEPMVLARRLLEGMSFYLRAKRD